MTYINMEHVKKDYEKMAFYSEGGINMVLKEGELESILFHIQNNDYYPEFEDKLTHLFYSVCKFHCFADGNKRMAIVLALHFMLLNGYEKQAEDFIPLTENLCWETAAGNLTKEEVKEEVKKILKMED